MGILTRFKDIMSANINAMLDKAEDPEKMMDQLMRNLTSDLAKVKSETAGIMAEETRARRALSERQAEIDRVDEFARKALTAGNEGDARQFLAKKNQLAADMPSLQVMADTAATNAANMRAMHDKLTQQVAELEGRRSMAKAKMASARTQERMNKVVSNVNTSCGSLDAFGRMEAKASAALDKANAMAELNSLPEDPTADLMSKYSSPSANDGSIDSDLAALKAEMGLY